MHLIIDFEPINFRKSEILIGLKLSKKVRLYALPKNPQFWSRLFSKKLVFLVVYGFIMGT